VPRDFLRTRLTVVMHHSGFRVRYIVGRPRCDAMSDDVGIQKPEGQRKAPRVLRLPLCEHLRALSSDRYQEHFAYQESERLRIRSGRRCYGTRRPWARVSETSMVDISKWVPPGRMFVDCTTRGRASSQARAHKASARRPGCYAREASAGALRTSRHLRHHGENHRWDERRSQSAVRGPRTSSRNVRSSLVVTMV